MTFTNAPTARIVPAARMSRSLRHPVHPFYVKARPFAVMPCMIAPVWPGESLKSLLFQARAVTDPIKNPIIGWWLELYFFYVKLTDLQEVVRDVIPDLLTNPASTALSTIQGAHGGTGFNRLTYYPGGAGTVDWVELCRRSVVQHWFRDERDAWNAFLGGESQPVCQIQHNDVLDSVLRNDQMTSVDVDVEGPDANTTIQASEVVEAMRQYEMARLYGLTELTYEDWCRAFGVNVPAVEEQRPELIRYVRDWQYPSNTIDPTTGSPRSAVSWAIRERAGKTRYFREPGFICGYIVFRPKVYRSEMSGTWSSCLASNKAWVPPWLVNSWRDKYVQVADNAGPLPNDTDTGGYWFDVGDLARYGEQMIVRRGGDTSDTVNPVALPNSTMSNKRYPTATDQNNLFVAATDPGRECRADGVAALSIASSVHAIDTSPRGGSLVEI